MRCNQISAIKDTPTGHSIETSSFRFVQFLKKRQNLIAISGDELESFAKPDRYPDSRKLKPFLKGISLASLDPMGAGLTPGHYFALDGKLPGMGTLELSNPPGWGRKKEGKCLILRQDCNIFD